MADTLQILRALRGNSQRQIRAARLVMAESKDRQKQAEADWNAAMGADAALAMLEEQIAKSEALAAAPKAKAAGAQGEKIMAPEGEEARDGQADSKG